jgi:hypothetical protein
MNEEVTITKEEYEQLRAANNLLCQTLDDQGDTLDIYAQEYPELVKAAGFELEEK